MDDSEEDIKIKAEMDEILKKIDTIIEKIGSSLLHETNDSVQDK